MYNVIWSPKSREDLKSLEKEIALRIVRKVEELKLAPYHFVEKMTDVEAWRLRVGDYRVIIDIDENRKEIHVLKVGHRKKIYKSF